MEAGALQAVELPPGAVSWGSPYAHTGPRGQLSPYLEELDKAVEQDLGARPLGCLQDMLPGGPPQLPLRGPGLLQSQLGKLLHAVHLGQDDTGQLGA